MTGSVAQYAALSRRSILGIVRQPIAIVPTLTFPLLFLAINSASLENSIHLPGFPPVDSFLQFMIATTIIQGSLFGSVAAGSDMAGDIQDGFFDRLLATPVARTSILFGRVAGSLALGFLQAWLFFGVAFLFGLDVEGGAAGMLGVATIAALVAAGFGTLSMSFALRSGSKEVVQGSFPALFAFLFFSSGFFPRDLMEGWFKTAATINPLSHLIEGTRALVIAGWSSSEFFKALAIAAVLLAFGLALSLAALRARLAERS